jgi:two-component system, OmpR family, phosphate regulon response regulator OmpR
MTSGTASVRPCTVVVVDDDARIRDLLKRYLAQEGIEVLLAETAAALFGLLSRHEVDVIVLDLMLPGVNGLDICKQLRSERNSTPIIMLTAKTEDADRITGLEIGADDYMCKPFNPRELLARIRAIMRRRPTLQIPGAPSLDRETYLFGPYRFDLGQRSLSKNGKDIELTTGEYTMLKVLAQHARQPISREKLSLLTRGREFDSSDRSLDVQVSRLRKLIEPDPDHPRYIQTVWGVGYVFVPGDESAH